MGIVVRRLAAVLLTDSTVFVSRRRNRIKTHADFYRISLAGTAVCPRSGERTANMAGAMPLKARFPLSSLFQNSPGISSQPVHETGDTSS